MQRDKDILVFAWISNGSSLPGWKLFQKGVVRRRGKGWPAFRLQSLLLSFLLSISGIIAVPSINRRNPSGSAISAICFIPSDRTSPSPPSLRLFQTSQRETVRQIIILILLSFFLVFRFVSARRRIEKNAKSARMGKRAPRCTKITIEFEEQKSSIIRNS